MSHIPTSINISYNQETNTLYVTVYHDTVDPNTHYIYLIRIYVNATEVFHKGYANQTNNDYQQDVFIDIYADPGDTIYVGAWCTTDASLVENYLVPPIINEYFRESSFVIMEILMVISVSNFIRKNHL